MDKKEKKITPWFSLTYLAGGTIGIGVLSGSTVHDSLSLLLVTAVVFGVFPLIVRTVRKRPMERRAAIKFTVINNLTGYLVFDGLFAFVFYAAGEPVAGLGFAVIAVFMVFYAALWYFPVYSILRHGALKKEKESPTTA